MIDKRKECPNSSHVHQLQGQQALALLHPAVEVYPAPSHHPTTPSVAWAHFLTVWCDKQAFIRLKCSLIRVFACHQYHIVESHMMRLRKMDHKPYTGFQVVLLFPFLRYLPTFFILFLRKVLLLLFAIKCQNNFCHTCFSKVRYRHPVFRQSVCPSFHPQFTSTLAFKSSQITYSLKPLHS